MASGLAVGDLVRDGAVLLLGIVALGMAWDFDGPGRDHWWVVVSVLFTWASLAVPYLGRFGLVKGLSPQLSYLVKAALNVPAALSILAALVVEIAHVSDEWRDGGFIGPAVGMLGAAVVLAAQPRLAEYRPGRTDALWRVVAGVLFGLVGAVAVGCWVVWILTTEGALDSQMLPYSLGTNGLSTVFPTVVLLLVTAVVVLGRDTTVSLAVGAVVGLGFCVAGVFSSMGELIGVGFGAFNSPSGSVLFFLVPVAGALCVAHPALARRAGAEPVLGSARWWVAAVRNTVTVGAVGAAAFLPGLLSELIQRDDDRLGGVVLLLGMLVAAGALGVCVVVLSGAGGGTRAVAVTVLAVALLVSFTSILVAHNPGAGAFGTEPARTWLLRAPGGVVMLVIPLLGLLALTLPPSVRRDLGPLNSSPLSRAETAQTWGAATPPAAPPSSSGQPAQPGQPGQPGHPWANGGPAPQWGAAPPPPVAHPNPAPGQHPPTAPPSS